MLELGVRGYIEQNGGSWKRCLGNVFGIGVLFVELLSLMNYSTFCHVICTVYKNFFLVCINSCILFSIASVSNFFFFFLFLREVVVYSHASIL